MQRLVADTSTSQASSSGHDATQLGSGVLGALSELVGQGLLSARPGGCGAKRPVDQFDSVLQVRRRRVVVKARARVRIPAQFGLDLCWLVVVLGSGHVGRPRLGTGGRRPTLLQRSPW